jgi:hypothetical protein
MIAEHTCPSCAPVLEALSVRLAALEAHLGLDVPAAPAVDVADEPAPKPVAPEPPSAPHPAQRKVPPADVPGLLDAILTEGLSLQDAGRRYGVPGSYIGRLCEREAAAQGRMREWLTRPVPRGRGRGLCAAPLPVTPSTVPAAPAPPPSVAGSTPPIQRFAQRPVAPLPRLSLEGRTWCPACGRKLERGACPGDLCEYRVRPETAAPESRR